MSYKKWYDDPIYKTSSDSKKSYWKSFGSWGRDWDDYWLDDYGGDTTSLTGYKPPKEDKKANNTVVCEEALKSISRSANAILNNGQDERKLTVKFSDDANKNTIQDNTIYLSPDKLLACDNREDKYEVMDALCGQSMLAAQLKRQIDADTYSQFCSSNDNSVKSLWSAIELAVARGNVISDWVGFKPYFDNYAEYSSKVTSTVVKRDLSKHNGSSPLKPTSSKAFIRGLAWNLYHSHDPVKIPEVYNDGKALVSAGLADADTPMKRWNFCKEVVEKLRQMYDHESEKPKTPSTTPEKFGEDQEDLQKLMEEILKTDESAEQEIKLDKKKGIDKFSGIDEDLFGLKNVDNKKFKGAADLMAVSGESSSESKDTMLAPMVPHTPGKVRGSRDLTIAYNFWVEKDKPTTVSKKFFNKGHLNSLDKAADTLKDSFGFVEKEFKRKVFGVSNGIIHEASLYKLNLNSDEVFYKKTVNDTDKVSVCLLVDQSGSMGCSANYERNSTKITEAAEVAYVLAKLCKDIKNLDLSVLGFSAQEHCNEARARLTSTNKNGEVNMRLIYDALDDKNNNIEDICHMRPHSNNLDGFSIWHAAKYMAFSRQERKRKVIIVISDGSPNGQGYDGECAMEHVNICRKDAKAKFGVDVYAIGIANAYSKEEGDKMYGAGRNIVISDVKSSLGYLSRFLNQVSQT